MSGLIDTFYLSRACLLRADRPITGASVSINDCFIREIFLVTRCAGKAFGVPDGLYVFSVPQKSKLSTPDSTALENILFEDDIAIVKFLLRTANFSLVFTRCSVVPGTMFPNTPKTCQTQNSSISPIWTMVDFVPLFSIVNMESEHERSKRLSRIAREAFEWDLTMREFRDRHKPKMVIPHTPSARSSTGAPAAGGSGGKSGCLSCAADHQCDQTEKVLPPLTFDINPPIICDGVATTSICAARFFITFQHPEEIKSETPSILSLALIGHTDLRVSTKEKYFAGAREILSLELQLLKGIYGSCERQSNQIVLEYEKDGQLILSVHVPQRRIVSFVSPASGKGEAVSTWTLTLLPVLYCGRFSTLGIVTTRRGHAEDIVADSAPREGRTGKYIFSSNDILVSVGGDGVAHEICNGIARRNNFASLPLKKYDNCPVKEMTPLTQQNHKDFDDPEQQAARRHSEEIWADVPQEDPAGYYEVPEEVLEGTPCIGLVAAGSGCALAKEAEVENFIVSALSLLHLRPKKLDIYRMDPFDIPDRTLRASDARYMKTEAERNAIKVRNSIEGSISFSKASETPVRFGMLALMFAAVNEIDKGSEGMRWMGNTRFTVKTMTMIVSGVPLYRVYFRYSTDRFYQPEIKAPLKNLHFGRSYVNAQASLIQKGCTEWNVSPNFRVAFMSLNNIRMVARDVCFAPFARPCDGFIDSLHYGPSEYDSTDPCYKMKVKRRDALDFFTKSETGQHVNDNSSTYGKCRRVQVIPIDGNVMADGEVMNKTGITVSSVRNALIILGSPSMNWDN